ncbi:MAG TPA: hypothetical protein VNK46_16330 [Nitrospiraceae bacterium]|jgi:rhodanese-related sulfurtransferase|nr:hypothetical protein [Nitrospiraceae bacterium]
MKHNPGFLKLVEAAKRCIKVCTVAEVKAKFDRGETFHFLDVREDHEFAKDHARGPDTWATASSNATLRR